MLVFVAFALAQVTNSLAPPPPPPAAFEDWAALQPVENSDRVSVLCRAAGRITAEFRASRHVVSVTSVEGLSHRLSPSERDRINAAVAHLSYLDRVEIGCNGPNQAVITVLGAFSQMRGKRMRRLVNIVWEHAGITGTGGRKIPEMELSANIF